MLLSVGPPMTATGSPDRTPGAELGDLVGGAPQLPEQFVGVLAEPRRQPVRRGLGVAHAEEHVELPHVAQLRVRDLGDAPGCGVRPGRS